MTRETKYSGVEWIGNISSEWKVEKNKHCFELTKNIVGEEFENYKLLSLTKKGIVIKDENNSFGKVPDSYETYQSVKQGQLVLCLFDLDCSAVFSGLSNYDGMISPAYKIYNCKECIDKKYAEYWFDYCFDGRKYMIYSKSLRYVVNADDFGTIEIAIPPLSEQKKIADFLDGKVSEIDKIIAETKLSIENHKEYKQSVITEAVTKGLDKNVPMKDSGIEWIGDIPVGWNVVRIKNTSSLRGRIGWQGLKTSDYQDNGAYLITGTDFRNGIINWQTCVHISDERFVEDENIHIHENDLLITKDGTIGKVAIAKNCPEKVSLNSGVLLIRNDKNIKYNGLYMYFMLNSNVFWKWYNSNQMGNSTIKHLYQGQFENFSFPLPKLNEQTQIAEYLDIKCTEIENSISEKEQLISNLEEYKKSLIYEYVTGKRTV